MSLLSVTTENGLNPILLTSIRTGIIKSSVNKNPVGACDTYFPTTQRTARESITNLSYSKSDIIHFNKESIRNKLTTLEGLIVENYDILCFSELI